jgi:predicted transcriptional regulator
VKRDDIKTIKDKIGGEKYIYDIEREKAINMNKDFTELKRKMLEDDGNLKSSRARH